MDPMQWNCMAAQRFSFSMHGEGSRHLHPCDDVPASSTLPRDQQRRGDHR